MSTIALNLQAVLRRIDAAAKAAGRDPAEVRLLAVSKTWPAAYVDEAWRAGQKAFGENHEQEAARKIAELSALPIEWHFIGPIQSNKTRGIAEGFAWVHSIDRLRIAQRLSDQRPAALGALNVCVQVNVSGEASKSGVAEQDAPALARAVAALPNLRLRGLMTIPEPTSDLTRLRGQFARLRVVKERLAAEGIPLDTLSMGMSDDLEAAVQEGATLVRVGTAVFGARTKKPTTTPAEHAGSDVGAAETRGPAA